MGKIQDAINKAKKAAQQAADNLKKQAEITKGQVQGQVKITTGQVKGGVNNAGKNVKKVFNTVLDKVQNINIDKKIGFLALLPFKRTMFNALKRKGVKNVQFSDNIGKISVMFYNIVMLGKTSYSFAYYDRFNNVEDELISPELKSQAAAAASQYTGGVVSEGDANKIIEAIIKFITNLTGKKVKGERMTGENEEIATDGVADINNTDLDNEGNVIPKVENWYSASWVKWAIGAIGIVLLYLVIKKLSK